jgi:hypothetical protein
MDTAPQLSKRIPEARSQMLVRLALMLFAAAVLVPRASHAACLTSPPACPACLFAICNSAAGEWACDGYVAAGTACNPGNACILGAQCDGAGTCTGTPRITINFTTQDLGALFGGPIGTPAVTIQMGNSFSILINPTMAGPFVTNTVLHELGHVFENAYMRGGPLRDEGWATYFQRSVFPW